MSFSQSLPGTPTSRYLMSDLFCEEYILFKILLSSKFYFTVEHIVSVILPIIPC